MRTVIALLLTLGVGGCDPNANANCDGGTTLYSQCQAVYQTLCDQAQRCGLSSSSSCVSDTITHCPCAAENCDAGSCSTQASVPACQQDLASEDCNYIVNYATSGYWPADCQPFMSTQ